MDNLDAFLHSVKQMQSINEKINSSKLSNNLKIPVATLKAMNDNFCIVQKAAKSISVTKHYSKLIKASDLELLTKSITQTTKLLSPYKNSMRAENKNLKVEVDKSIYVPIANSLESENKQDFTPVEKIGENYLVNIKFFMTYILPHILWLITFIFTFYSSSISSKQLDELISSINTLIELQQKYHSQEFQFDVHGSQEVPDINSKPETSYESNCNNE